MVDAGTLELLVRLGWAGLYVGRVLSYLAAATVTWWLNARFTFRTDGNWVVYVIVNALGAAVNYGVYVFVLWAVPQVRELPSVAVAAGSAVALLVNFATNRWIVFGRG